MKKVLSLVMAVVMICLALVACGGDPSATPSATTATDKPVVTTLPGATTAPQEETEPEPFYANELVKDGKSEYVIVYDGTTASMVFARELRSIVNSAYGIMLSIVKASDRAEGDYEIVVGDARDVSKATTDKLVGEYDFAIKSEDKKIVFTAKDEISYLYLAEYLRREVIVKSEQAAVVIDSNDNRVYSDSALCEKNYVEYMIAANKAVALSKICTAEKYTNSDTVLPYRIYVPFNYSPDKEYPIFVNLHGAGHRGNDNEKHVGFVGSLLTVEDLPLNDSIIIFPQCPENNKWGDTDWGKGSYSLDAVPESNELRALVELIEKIKKDYSVDEKRIYACGLSMGGYGVWNLLMRHPDLFTGGVAMCGAADPSKASVLVDMPVWAVHGAKDPTVPVSGSREMVNAIKALGGTKIQYTELPNNEHDVWTYTYANVDIFRWLYQQTKD